MKQPVKNFLVTIGLIVVTREIGGRSLPLRFLILHRSKERRDDMISRTVEGRCRGNAEL